MSKKKQSLIPIHKITESDIIDDTIALSMLHYDIESKGLLNLIKIVKPSKDTIKSLPTKLSKSKFTILSKKSSKGTSNTLSKKRFKSLHTTLSKK